MKKIFVLIFMLAFSFQMSLAKDKDYTLNFNGTKYHLLYSVKNKDFGGYLNEYYKKGETYNIWSELLAVHHFPNAYSPIDRIRDFKEYLGSMHVPSSLTFDDKKNTAMIDFIMIQDRHMPIVLEFNIFKYEKSKKCGSIAIQYSKRYSATTTMEIEQIKKMFEKDRKHLITKVKNLSIPEVITKDIDKCIVASEVRQSDKAEIVEDVKIASENDTKKEIITKEESSTEVTAEKTEEDIKTENRQIDENNTNIVESNELKEIEPKETKTEIITVSENVQEAVETPEQKKVDTTENSKKLNTEPKENDKSSSEEKIIKPAPIPIAEPEEQKFESRQDKKTDKKIKNVNYEVSNTKGDYIAVPRTKKELKAEVKQNKIKQKDMKKQAKKDAKAAKQQAKTAIKNQKKEEKILKKSKKKEEKAARKPYEISNSNSELAAKPRTKKDLKNQSKKYKKELKEKLKIKNKK